MLIYLLNYAENSLSNVNVNVLKTERNRTPVIKNKDDVEVMENTILSWQVNVKDLDNNVHIYSMRAVPTKALGYYSIDAKGIQLKYYTTMKQ